ncbi:MAG: hypothetical protein H6733_00045 [Alphaproteobacteria bacterium]|nr:hypothetical protein [Alphaproteobacteria bacterium]
MAPPPRALLPWLLAGCALATPPSCETGDEAACFTGAFRGLLGEHLGGVEVCAPDLPDVDCVVSDEDGTWKLDGLPVDADVTVTALLDGAVPTVFPQTTTMDWYAWYKVMVPLGIMDTNASNLGVTLDPDRGHVLFIAWEGLNLDGIDTPRVPDVTARLPSGGGLVFYANLVGLAAAGFEATTSNGSGGILNLRPGVHEVEISAPAGPCGDPMFHWAEVRPGVIPVPVLAGHTTAIDVRCPVQPAP